MLEQGRQTVGDWRYFEQALQGKGMTAMIDVPADVRHQMYFMEQMADELMRHNGDGDSTRANLDMMLDDDGYRVLASFRPMSVGC